MRIAFVNATHRWGGVKTWLLDFARTLAARGHSLRIYGRQPQFVEAARQQVGHGEVMRFGSDLNPMAIRRFMRAFREHGTEVVFINIGKDLATAGVAARLLGIPVVQQIGLPNDIPHRFKTEMLHRWIKPWFLSSCQYIGQGFMQSLPYIDPARCHVVLTAKPPVEAPVTLHHPRRLVATQQLFPDKGHATLLQALAEVKGAWELHIAGVGSEEAKLKKMALDLGIANRVFWHGFVNDVPSFLLEADIFLLASLSEGLPNTLQEALAAGLLPVMRDVGGVREVLSPPLLPWLLPYEADAAAFRAILNQALNLSDDAMLALREEAKTTRARFFDLDAKCTELEDWLQHTVLAGK